MKRKICKRCGSVFTTKGDNSMCQNCIAIVLTEMRVPDRIVPAKPKKNKKPQIVIDANAAMNMCISYGEYMARKKEGRTS